VDLDLFGRASLFHFLCAADTSVGFAILRDWLVQPANPPEVRRRQEAVRQLTPCAEYREALTRQARLLSRSRGAPERLMQWAESEPWLARRAWLAWTAWLLPASAVTLLCLMSGGVLPPQIGGASLCAVLLAQAAISVLFAGRVHDIYATVSTRDREARRYRQLFTLLAEMPVSCAKLDDLRQNATQRGGAQSAGSARLTASSGFPTPASRH